MMRWKLSQGIRTAPPGARGFARRARYRARAGAAVGGARRPARSGQYPRWGESGAGLARQSSQAGAGRRGAGGDRTVSPQTSPRCRVSSDRLEFLLVDEPPYLARDGGFIRTGAHAPLDEMRALRDESRRVIAGLEGRYRQSSGVGQLKIKHNGVLGYFIEVTQQHADKLMADKDDCSAIARPWRARCAFPPTSWPAWPPASPKPATARWRWKRACSTRW